MQLSRSSVDASLAAEIESARRDPARVFGPFLLLAELGRGGMGVVHRAWDDRLRRVVALKTILPQDGIDASATRRFRREAEAVARLRHPAIVSIHDAGEIFGRHYISMDLVPGRSLEHRLRPGAEKIAFHKGIEVVRDVARAVHHAHSKDVIHRDLKPHNILLDEADRPYVVDFGLASIRGAATKLTKTGARMGTPAYMPPEQAGGEPPDARADVYSLGATLYHVLTGRPPFAGESDVNLVVAVLTKDPVPPGEINPRAAGDLETICLRCLEKEKARRYATAEDLAAELDRYLLGEPILARPIGRLERLLRRARRNKLAAALALLVLLASGAAVALGGSALAANRRSEADAARARERLAEHRASVLATLARARAEGAGFHDAALDALVSLKEPQTVELLGDALDAVSRDLEAATRDLLLSAKTPTPDEERAGKKHLDGLEEELSRESRLAPLERLRATPGGVLALARRRIEHRAAAARSPGGSDAVLSIRDLIGEAGARKLGTDGIALAKIACEALGKLALPGGATPLARYLAAEHAEERAVPAAIALLKLRDEEAARVVVASRTRFGMHGELWRQAKSFLASSGWREPLPTSARDYGDRGNMRMDRGDLDGALSDYSRAIELDPGLALAWMNRGIARAVKGDADAALADFTRAIEVDPHLGSAWANRAKARNERRDGAGAIADATRAIELEPRLATSWAIRGAARAQIGERDAAIQDLSRAVELEGRSSFVWSARGAVRGETGDFDGAIADCSKAIEIDPRDARAWATRGHARAARGELDAAISDCSRAIEINPRCVEGWRDRADARSRKGEIDSAIADMSKAVELDPGFAGSWMQRGLWLSSRGKVDAAIADLTRATELAPQSAGAWVDRGIVFANKGDFASAISDYSKALSIDPRLAAAWANRGNLRAAQGDFDGALADYDHAIELQPRLAAAWTNRANVKREKGDLDGALADHSRAIEIDGRVASVWSNRGCVREDQGDLDGAIADHTRAIELDPRFAGAWINRGTARDAKGDLDGAISDAARALEISPREAMAWGHRAYARARKGDSDGAASDAARALELDANEPAAWVARGLARSARGEREAAIKDLSRAIEIESKSRFAATARSKLAELERANR